MLAFNPGFRFSRLDGAFILAAFLATIVLAAETPWWGFVVGFVCANFFLFCNVFRVARVLELTWSALFLTLACATVMFDVPGWLITGAVSLAATIVVVLLEMRKPSYHGLGWQRINPTLPNRCDAQRNKARTP